MVRTAFAFAAWSLFENGKAGRRIFSDGLSAKSRAEHDSGKDRHRRVGCGGKPRTRCRRKPPLPPGACLRHTPYLFCTTVFGKVKISKGGYFRAGGNWSAGKSVVSNAVAWFLEWVSVCAGMTAVLCWGRAAWQRIGRLKWFGRTLSLRNGFLFENGKACWRIFSDGLPESEQAV